MKIKLWLYHEQWVYDTKGKIVAWHIKLDDELTGSRLRILLKEVEVEIPDVELLSDVQIKEFMVTGLRQEAKDLQSDTHMKLKQIDEKIQQLLCLENKELE